VTGAAVTRLFCGQLIQLTKDRVHPAYEYWGQSEPTCEVNRKVSNEEMAARVSQMYYVKVKVKKFPKAHSLKRPTNPVRSCDLSLGRLLLLSLFSSCNFPWSFVACRSVGVTYGVLHLFVRASCTSTNLGRTNISLQQVVCSSFMSLIR
jgi:hypothetical protein